MKIWPLPKKRMLRSFIRTARQNHGNCSCCHKPIEAGDEYECFIQVLTFEGKKYLQVFKYHLYCPFDPDDDPEEEIHREEQSQTRIAA